MAKHNKKFRILQGSNGVGIAYITQKNEWVYESYLTIKDKTTPQQAIDYITDKIYTLIDLGYEMEQMLYKHDTIENIVDSL